MPPAMLSCIATVAALPPGSSRRENAGRIFSTVLAPVESYREVGGKMLHATCRRGKSTLYERYLGKRDGAERKVHEEDEITSTVIGPLDFLPPEDVFRFWNGVLAKAGAPMLAHMSMPASAVIRLWHWRLAGPENRRIEPDVRVDFEWPDGSRRILLVEMKWRARLSGEDQLHRQWQHYLTEAEREIAWHLFVAPEVSAGAAARELPAGDVWRGRLVLISWLQVRSALADIMRAHENGLGRWAVVADGFLERVGIRKFAGFGAVLGGLPCLANVQDVLFWEPWRGWRALESRMPRFSGPIAAPLFFTEK